MTLIVYILFGAVLFTLDCLAGAKANKEYIAEVKEKYGEMGGSIFILFISLVAIFAWPAMVLLDKVGEIKEKE